MIKLAISLQLVFAVLFGIALIGTFTELDDIKERSRDEITQKVVAFAETNVGLAEEMLTSPKVMQFLADHQVEVIQSEIDSFRRSPEAYVAELTQDETVVSATEVASDNPLVKALFAKVLGWKMGIKRHFDSTFNKLVVDLRIFCTTNVLSLLLASFILVKREEFGKLSVSVSLILSCAIALSILSYIDQNWLFSILLNSYLGYGYPAGIVCVFFWLFYKYCEYKKNEQSA